ncbi:MAG: stage III sporulation protein AF [Clostridia bacterium]
MLESFKIAVSSLLCLAIFITILELIMPENKFKKYIYSIVGIVTIITLISPFVNIYKNEDILKNVFKSVEMVDNSYKGENVVKEEFIKKFSNDITNKLKAKDIIVKKVDIELLEDFSIKKVVIYSNLKKDEIISFLISEYDLNKSNISVIGG